MPVEIKKNSQNKSKFHHYSMINYRGYALYWLILIAFLGFLISLPFIYVDVSVTSRGSITSLNKMVSLSSPVTAKVTEVRIVENLKVNAGDTLIVLQQSGIKNEIMLTLEQLQLQTNYIEDLSNLLLASPKASVNTPLYYQEAEDYKSSLNKHKRHIEKLSIDFSRTSELFKEGVLPLTTYQEDSFKWEAAKDELLMFKTATSARWETDRKNYIISNQTLNSKVENLRQQQSQYQITAPFDGSIIDFTGIAQGNFLNESQFIAFLSPQQELIAECYISSSDIGFIHKGMNVQLQIDTYDYNQWGMLSATVFEVADDVSLVGGNYQYLIRCKLQQDNLQLSNGLKGYMKKGMSLTARFIVTQRSLYQLLFDTVDDWLNPNIISVTKLTAGQ